MKPRYIPKPPDFLYRLNAEQALIVKERRRAQAIVARKGQHTGSRSPQRKVDNDTIADYLARNPNPVKSV